VFVPIAAVLLSFVLAPLLRFLERWHVPRGLSTINVVSVAFISIFALGGVLASQLAQLAGDLPRYEVTIREKIRSLRGTAAPSATLERAADVLQDLGKELNKPKDALTSPTTSLPPPGQEVRPIPVEVRQPPPTTLENLASLIAPLLRPLTTTGIMAIFVIFILLQREELRNRFIKLAGSHDLQKTTAALDDGARRLSRLFLIQLALNTSFGVLIGIGLWLIGIPSPVLWGILAAVLRFVPYIGAIISAVFPLALAAAVDPGWSMLLLTAALFLIVEPVLGHVIEPPVYGRSTGLSPIAVVASATFWTALWGPVGLVLSTPLTICLVVLGRHVERLQFLDVMFGDRPALSPPEMFYQRMLAEDPAEVADQAEEFLKEKPLLAYYDEVALPGLQLAQKDTARGALDRAQGEKIKAAVIELISTLAEYDYGITEAQSTQNGKHEPAANKSPDASFAKGQNLNTESKAGASVLCLAGRGPLDEAAALILAQLLQKCGMQARVDAREAVATLNITQGETSEVTLVCLSYVDPSSPAHMRYTLRRLRHKLPKSKILLGCWMADEPAAIRENIKPDEVATSLGTALSFCLQADRTAVSSPFPVQTTIAKATAAA
jgi:predicted PurR-regulated permease PerM